MPDEEKSWTQRYDEMLGEKAVATVGPGPGDLLLAHYVPNETPQRRETARAAFRRYGQLLLSIWDALYGDVEKSPKSLKSTDEDEWVAAAE